MVLIGIIALIAAGAIVAFIVGFFKWMEETDNV